MKKHAFIVAALAGVFLTGCGNIDGNGDLNVEPVKDNPNCYMVDKNVHGDFVSQGIYCKADVQP